MVLNDKEIILRLQEDDRHVFELIFNAYFPRLFHFAKGYLANENVAEDIIQDVFVEFWVQRHKFNADVNLNAWLYTVSKNKCIKFIDHLKVKEKYKSFTEQQKKELTLNQIALNRLDTSEFSFLEMERLIQDTLKQLPPQCRRIFEMSRFEDKKYREIAEELGISVKTVETQMSKALKLFRENLKDYLSMLTFLFLS
ncbi:RNA polymerase sigma-70 factor [Prolixibacteraceae bacterium JC049]|nr:RNA polymerase sigma-70 factor [Prolixibacteraceae bacterium JC049]